MEKIMILDNRYKVFMKDGAISYILDTQTSKKYTDFKRINNDVYIIFENNSFNRTSISVSICDLKNEKYISNVYKINNLNKNNIFNIKKPTYDSFDTFDRIRVNKNIICFYNVDKSKFKTSSIYDMNNGLLLEYVYTSYNDDNMYVRSRFGKLILYDGNKGEEAYLEEIKVHYTNIEEKEEYSDITKSNSKTIYVFNYNDVIFRRLAEDNKEEYYKVPSNLNISKRFETTSLLDNDVIYKYFDCKNEYCFNEPLERLESNYLEDYDCYVVKLNNELIYIKDGKEIKRTNINEKELTLNKKSTLN